MKKIIINQIKSIMYALLIGFIIITFFIYRDKIPFYKDFQKNYINPLYDDLYIEKDISKSDKYIVKDYDKTIIIVLDDFLDVKSFLSNGKLYGHSNDTHGGFVINYFNKFIKNNNISKNDYKIIGLNRKIISDKTFENSLKGIFVEQQIVNFIDKYEVPIKNEYYDYNELIKYISKSNPKAKIIINQSFQNPIYTNDLKPLELDNVYISRAMPYKNIYHQKILVELFGYIHKLDHEKLLYVTLCNDYQPTFSKNIVCTNERSTSVGSPIEAFKYFILK